MSASTPQWQRVTVARMCAICDAKKYCLFEPRLGWALCTRVKSAAKYDDHWHGWIHYVEPTPGEYLPEAAVSEHPPALLSDEEATERDRLYRFLADHPLSTI